MPKTFGMHDVAAVIPAYKPSSRTVDLARELRSAFDTVVLVDDGSGADFASLFSEMEALGCVVIRHNVNLGKGRALKTAFNYLIGFGVVGAVTADADGQHCFEDIVSCAERLAENPDSLIMGCRDFKGRDVPWPNKTGNRITSVVMSALCGVRVSDTQTGLRAIPLEFMKHLMNIHGERYEFETEMLLETRNIHLPIVEQPIHTIYIDNNASSHYNRVTDSWLIYKKFLKFIASSLVSTGIDLLIFAIMMSLLDEEWVYAITVSTIVARILSCVCNYFFNRSLFKSRRNAKVTFLWYSLFAIFIMGLSAVSVSLLQTILGWEPIFVKMMVDSVIFLLSYSVQSRYIFKD